MKEDINMKPYDKPQTEILEALSESLLAGTVDPNRDNDDENGGSMGNASFFDDADNSSKSNLWDD